MDESSFGGGYRQQSPTFSLQESQRIESRLRSRIRGEVRFDDGSRALYATDASNYRQVPIGVVLPRDIEDVIETIAVCREHGAPVLPRGGGTSLAGQCCNVAVVLDMSKYMHKVLELDPDNRFGRVQPGAIYDALNDAALEYGLTFGPDPATHNRCTVGGMIGNNSCGIHSVMAGKTSENIVSLNVVTYDGLQMEVGETSDRELDAIIRGGGRRGEIYARLKALRDKYGDLIRAKYPKIPRRVSGYSLDKLLPENGFQVAQALVGSEGTCVTVLEAKTRLVSSPPARSLLVLGYTDVYRAAADVPLVLEHKPVGLEGLDGFFMQDMQRKNLLPDGVQLFPEGNGWLLAELGGENKEESNGRARELMAHVKKPGVSMELFDHPERETLIWEVRESGLGATSHVPGRGETWTGWEDSAVHPEKLADYLPALRDLLNRYGYYSTFYGHFGDGCLHSRIDFDLRTKAGIEKYGSFVYEAANLVTSLGGSLSGEHGDGQSRAELLPIMYGEELIQAFREFKSIWDPRRWNHCLKVSLAKAGMRRF